MERKFYDLTNPQKSIWFTEEYFKGTSMENICGSVITSKNVKFDVLEKAINKFIELNNSFRLKFVLQDGILKQFVDETKYFSIETININSINELKELERTLCDTPFNIFECTLFKFKLLKFKDGHGGFIICIHHLIADAWTTGFGASEIMRIYNQLLNNSNSEFESNPSYIDYINSEKEYLTSPKFEKDKVFWLEKYATIPEIASIPSINKTSDVSSSIATRKEFILSTDFVELLNSYCKQNKFSIFNLFMAVLAIYVGRTSNLDDFVLGTPILNRTNFKDKHTTGMFISTVPLRVNINHNLSFADFTSQISKDFFSIFKHEKYPYQYLLEELRKNENVPNLYNVLLSYQNIRSTAQNEETPFEINWIPNKYTADELDIHLYDMNDTGLITIAYDYQVNKYSNDEIEATHKRLMYIIKQILDNNNICLKDIEIITPDEKNQILYEFNNTKTDYPKDKTIIELFEEQVQKNSDNIAVVFENQKLTYKELNEKANSLANYLTHKMITKGDIVPVLMNRSIELIISMLAILKSGAIYLPISVEYPSDRINYILQNSNSKIILTNNSLSTSLPKNVISININNFNYLEYSNKHCKVPHNIDDTIYIIYTSGSTGNPKGVKICNKNLSNFIFAFNSYFGGINKNDKCLASTNIAFDVSIWEFFISLLNGATLYLYSENTISDIFKFCNSIIENSITLLYIPPNILESVYNIISKYQNIKIDKLLIGVEPIGSAIMNKYYSLNHNLKIINGYGPTETTICATANVLEPSTIKNYRVIPIGKPLKNLQLFVLNKDLHLCPIGIPGELYISGIGVGQGYLNNAKLTDEVFFKLPSSFNSCFAYKTGDLVAWNPDGNISFVGRKDNQVKINGHRIELGEIESCIYQYPDIDKVVVLLDNNKKIIAYFSSSFNINISDLRAFLQKKLANYFIPNFFIQINSFKLTPNGKVDKKALLNIKINTKTIYEAAHNDYQQKLVEIFESILGIPKIGINDNFFELGGDSMSAIKLQIDCFNHGIELSYKDIFTYPTIKLLSENIVPVLEPIKEDNYDYSNINNLIAKNNADNLIVFNKNKIKNILLTGATGYLGCHILDKLLKHTKCNIYCLIRRKNNNDAQTRLLDVLRFYFGNKYDKQIEKRIFAIEGNIAELHFGLSNFDYEELGKSISHVINSAAIVKHYGNSNIFNKTNVSGTQNIIDFCEKFSCTLIHISTLSVAGNSYFENNGNSNLITFSENKFYINQDLSNIYTYTKFIAERLIFEHILSNKLNASIIRVGNVTNRFSDGTFQINISENAFLNKLNSFIQIGFIPDYLLEQNIEFSPVDICAFAIVKILLYNKKYTVFHVYNNNYIKFKDLITIFDKLNIHIEVVDANTFYDKIKELSKNNTHIISGIINDFNKDKTLNYKSNIISNNDFTNTFLKAILFRWPKIDEKYIYKYIYYLRLIGYIQ